MATIIQSSPIGISKDEEDFLRKIPKVELHVHIEGTLEPDLLLTLAKRNSVDLPYNSLEEIVESRKFTELDDFLAMYYQGMSVLHSEQDFYDLTDAYLRKVHQENVKHAEIFFDPQPHIVDEQRPHVNFDTVVNGIHRALIDWQDKISTKLIMCFVRHLPVDHAMETLEMSLPHRDKIYAVGLDSTEKGKHPELYQDVFEKAREYGYQCVAHAGEEGPAEYVWGALDVLKVHRIDHGVRAADDPALIEHLQKRQTPLTVCPLSNICLCVFPTMKDHNIKELLEAGVCVTINSDDPAYFGGYLTDNFLSLAELDMERHHHIQLVRNSIEATFLKAEEKGALHDEVDKFLEDFERISS